jgi:hypothetical protein
MMFGNGKGMVPAQSTVPIFVIPPIIVLGPTGISFTLISIKLPPRAAYRAHISGHFSRGGKEDFELCPEIGIHPVQSLARGPIPKFWINGTNILF